MKRLVLWIFLLLLLAPLSVLGKAGEKDALPVEVNSRIDRDSVYIGDGVRYEIVVKAKKNIEIELPHFEENLAGWTVKDKGSKKSGPLFGNIIYSQWVVLEAYTIGSEAIPALTIKYRREGSEKWETTQTEAIDIEIKSVLAGDIQTGDIKDIKPPLDFPLRYGPYIIVLALILLAGFFWRRHFRKKSEIGEVKTPLRRPAHLIAYEALERLERKGLAREGKIKEYYIELSGIIREYLEARFSLRAPEMTTEEFLTTVKDRAEFSREQKNLLKDFLLHSDLVKFAKYGPSAKEMDLSFASAKRLIDQTKIEL